MDPRRKWVYVAAFLGFDVLVVVVVAVILLLR